MSCESPAEKFSQTRGSVVVERDLSIYVGCGFNPRTSQIKHVSVKPVSVVFALGLGTLV